MKEPAGISTNEWNGRKFDPDNPNLFIRVERQTLTGFTTQQALLFTIRTYFYEVKELNKQEMDALILAIESMSPATLDYKGLLADKDLITNYLRSLF